MPRAYRPALRRGTTPWSMKTALGDLADRPFDQGFVVDNGDRLMRSVGIAAGDHDREFLLRGDIGKCDGRRGAEPGPPFVPLRFPLGFRTAGRTLGNQKDL